MIDMKKQFLTLSLLVAAHGAQATTPNVVFIYADDLGYGDVSCYGATRVQTPNIDKLAAQGLKFTDAHAPAATCTPSRYALLTGEYAFRQKGTGILPGDVFIFTHENDTGPDGANHDPTGIFVMKGAPGQISGRKEGMNLVDVGPTILNMYGIETPEGAVGRNFL